MNNIIILAVALHVFALTAKGQDIRKSMITSQKVYSGLNNYLELIPRGHEHYYGFDDRSEFGHTKFGRPLRIYSAQQY